MLDVLKNVFTMARLHLVSWIVATSILALFELFIGVSPSFAQTSGRKATLEDCIVSLHDQALIPAQQAGVLLTLEVREGAIIAAGQSVGHIDAAQQTLKHNLAEIERQAAQIRAAEDIDIRFSKASAAVAETEYQQSLDANQRLRNTIPQPEIRRLKLAAHKTLLQIEKAASDQQAAELVLATRQAEAKLAANEVARCQVISPIKGEIAELMRKPGEWVNPGDSIARVVRLDVLRVEGFLKISDYNPLAVDGATVEVTVSLTGGRKASFPGTIVFVAPLVQAGGQYRVWAEVANREIGKRWVLRPGMTAEMTVMLNEP